MESFSTVFRGQMTGMEITCLQSFLDHGHSVTIYAYEDCRAPAHFRIADAAGILHEDRVFYYKTGPGKGSIACFANLFRYALLSKTDDWWIDTDVVCLSSRWPTNEGRIVAGWQDEELVNCAVLRLEATFAVALYEAASASGDEIEWGQTGPKLVTEFVKGLGLEESILNKSDFYPTHHSEWPKLLRTEDAADVRAAATNSFAIHLWNELIRRSGFDKARIPKESFFGELVALHATQQYFQE